MIKGGVSPFECDLRGNTALHYAVRRGHAAMCKRLINAGADAEVQNQIGHSAWDLALQYGHAAVRRIFSPSAADRDLSRPVSDAGKAGATPLLVAAWKGDLAAIQTALKGGGAAQIEEVGLVNCTRPLMCTATAYPLRAPLQDGNHMVSRSLLVAQAWKAGGTTPLMLAARKGDAAIVECLLQAGASCSARSRRGTCPLSMAAEEGNTDAVRVMLVAGAEVDVTDDDGFTALYPQYGSNPRPAASITAHDGSNPPLAASTTADHVFARLCGQGHRV